ncbi:MAG: exonuclease SbcCD subunit D [Tuberibacillus sp.]
MRLMHTADWHLGRTLEGRSRHEEQERVLIEMCQIAESEEVDAVIMAGDVFDSVNPPAQSETLFYEIMKEMSADGRRPIIVISGNHDSPERIEAASPLARSHNITLVGHPVREAVKVGVPMAGEILNMAALPYPSESRLHEVLSEINDDELIRKAYDERIGFLLKEHARAFQPDHVNIVMSHLFIAGGSESDSERPIQVGGAYTVTPPSLSVGSQYIALGHLHRPQTLKGFDAPARYSGSPLAYSFSEANQAKSVTIIDVAPGERAQVKEVILNSGKPLVRWNAVNGLEEVYQWLDEGRDPRAWIDLEITLKDALSIRDIQQLRRQHSGIIHIRPIFLTEEENREEKERLSSLPLETVFHRFYSKQMGGAAPDDKLVELFLDIVKEVDEEEDHHAAD